MVRLVCIAVWCRHRCLSSEAANWCWSLLYSAVVLGVESFVIATPPTSLSGTTSFVSAVNIYYTPDFVAAAVKSA